MCNTIRIQVIKYALVGLANTALTAIVIFGMMKMGADVYPANAIGYIVGIIFSFIMNAQFTFSSSVSSTKFLKFISVCTICYLFNIMAMRLFFALMPERIYTAQIVGMFFYTAIGFILNKYWSMK